MSMHERELQTRDTFLRYEKRRNIALATIRNIAREAEDRAAFTPPGSADRVALTDYADDLWRAHEAMQRAGQTATVFCALTEIEGVA